MTFIVASLGAAGLVLMVMSFPPLQAGRMSRRARPYLPGSRSMPGAPGIGTGVRRWIEARRIELVSPSKKEELERRLATAGREPDSNAYRLQQISAGALGFVAAGIPAAMGSVVGRPWDPATVILFALICGSTAVLASDRRLSIQIVRRNNRMRNDLPTAIDLLSLCLLAGESVPAAIARVGASFPGPLGVEFDHAVGEIRTGASVVESLESLCDRVPDPSIERFVSALITAIERGTPLAETLAAQADDIREIRRRELMEGAGRREVLMLVPVVFLILPVIVVFALLPGLVALDLLVP